MIAQQHPLHVNKTVISELRYLLTRVSCSIRTSGNSFGILVSLPIQDIGEKGDKPREVAASKLPLAQVQLLSPRKWVGVYQVS